MPFSHVNARKVAIKCEVIHIFEGEVLSVNMILIIKILVSLKCGQKKKPIADQLRARLSPSRGHPEERVDDDQEEFNPLLNQ